VVVDVPPSLVFADARIIARSTDGWCWCCASQTSWSAAAAAQRLRMDGVRILGTILNDWRPPLPRLRLRRLLEYITLPLARVGERCAAARIAMELDFYNPVDTFQPKGAAACALRRVFGERDLLVLPVDDRGGAWPSWAVHDAGAVRAGRLIASPCLTFTNLHLRDPATDATTVPLLRIPGVANPNTSAAGWSSP
jgi:hypothetical protein